MALVKRPGIKVLFVSFPEVEMHTEGIGEFLPRPFSQDELLTVVGRMVHQQMSEKPAGKPTPAGVFSLSHCGTGLPHPVRFK
jgi:hypothetical protein